MPLDDLHRQLAEALRNGIRAFRPYHSSWLVLERMQDAVDAYNQRQAAESAAAARATEKLTGGER